MYAHIQMVEILFQFAERSLKKCPEHGKIQVMEQHFQVPEPLLLLKLFEGYYLQLHYM